MEVSNHNPKSRQVCGSHPTTSLFCDNFEVQAKRLAAFKFGLKDSKAHYVVVRSEGYNAHSDRYTGVHA